MGRIAVNAWETTSEVDEAGYFKLAKHVVVSFELTGAADLCLEDFNHQNVIDRLSIEKLPSGLYRLTMEPCYGLSGWIDARTISITLEPGIPTDCPLRQICGTSSGRAIGPSVPGADGYGHRSHFLSPE